MILILKTGSTFESLKKTHGDFEDWISDKMDLAGYEYHVHSAGNYNVIPPNLNYTGIVITGSPLMVTDINLKNSSLCAWLLDKQINEVPILGICFGHQLLNIMNGGTVKNNESGYIVGSEAINLTSTAREDELFGDFPESFNTYKTHSQSVQKTSESSEILARSHSGIIDALSFAPRSWGVQFHPEFNSDIMQLYIENKKENLISEGINIASISSNSGNIDYGDKLLKRFKEITGSAK